MDAGRRASGVPSHPTMDPVMRIAWLVVACTVGGCGPHGEARPVSRPAPLPRPAPISAPVPPAPEPPRPIRSTLAELVPDPAPVSQDRGIDPDGRFYCRDPFVSEPGPEDAGCGVADGVAIRGALVHVWEPASTELWIDGPIEIERVTRCGERRRRLPRSALARSSPALARAEPAERLDTTRFASGACRDPRVSVEMPPGATHTMLGGVHRFELASGSGEVRVLAAGRVVASWPLGQGAIMDRCDRSATVPVERRVDLEVLCAADAAIVAALSYHRDHCWPCFSRCEQRPDPPPGVRCALAARNDFEARRLLVPLAGGAPVPIEIALPQVR